MKDRVVLPWLLTILLCFTGLTPVLNPAHATMEVQPAQEGRMDWNQGSSYRTAPRFFGRSSPASADAYSTDEDTPLSIAAPGVLANDSDPDALDVLTAHLVQNVTWGTLELNPDGSFTYVPDENYSGSDTFTYSASDGAALSEPAAVEITINPQNDPPEEVRLSSASVLENQPGGTLVGTFATVDPDAADSFTYTLIAGEGGEDNASFLIENGELKTNEVFDAGSKASYSIRVQAADEGGLTVSQAFTITILNSNTAPSQIFLEGSAVSENAPTGTTVGSFTTEDPDPGDSHTYAFVPGEGDTDNSAFTIAGNVLQTAQALDYETKTSYTIRVASGDSGGLPVEKSFALTVLDVDDPITSITLSNQTVPENQPVGTVVGTFTTQDQDPYPPYTYQLVDGDGSAGNALFSISGSDLETAGAFDFESQASYSIRVRATDDVGETFDAEFVITITDVDEAPAEITLSNAAIQENLPTGTVVGSFAVSGSDPGRSYTYSLLSGTDSFAVVGSSLETRVVFNYEAQSSFTITVRATDQDSQSVEKSFAVSVIDANDVPRARNDTYAVNIGSALTITPPGVLENDSDEDGQVLLASLAPSGGPLGSAGFALNTDGSFVYQPLDSFRRTDSFQYTANDGTADAVGAVNINVFQLDWVSPVGTGEVYQAGTETLDLEVFALKDDSPVSRVIFRRWDASSEIYVDIAVDDQGPFQATLETADLNPGWNQLFAIAEDSAGNRSERIWTWVIYQEGRLMFLPNVLH